MKEFHGAVRPIVHLGLLMDHMGKWDLPNQTSQI